MQQQGPQEFRQSLQGLRPAESVELKESSSSSITKASSKKQTIKEYSCICIHKDTLYLGTRNSRIYIYQITLNNQNANQSQGFTLKQVKMITPQYKTVGKIQANDEYFVAVPQTEDDSFISIWSATTKQFLIALDGHKSQVSSIVFMRNPKYMATSSWDSTIKIWSLENLQNPQAAITYKSNYPILELKELDQEILIFGSDDCCLVFWNWKKGEVIKKEFGHAGSVTYIEVMREFIFTAGGDNKFKFWEVIFTQSTNTSIDSRVVELKQKYQIKKVVQHNEEYDSIVFGVYYDIYLLLIDKLGKTFLFTQDTEIYRMGNYFEADQEISDVDVFGDFLLVITSKGVLKHINIKSEISKITFSLTEQKIIPSQTKIQKVESESQEKGEKNSKK